MLIIGESLNSSIPKTLAILEPFDEAGVRDLVRAQLSAGAEVLDINTALTSDELSLMRRVAAIVKEEGGVPMFGSPSPEVLKTMLEESEGRAFINSVTLTERQEILPLCAAQIASGRELFIVALPVGEELPQNAGDREANVEKLMEIFAACGIPAEHIWVDVVVEALSVNTESANKVLAALTFVRERYPSVRTLCGLSNVSFGLPMRAELNRAFLCLLVSGGLSGAILNATAPSVRRTVAALSALLGEDEYCMNYLTLYRELEG